MREWGAALVLLGACGEPSNARTSGAPAVVIPPVVVADVGEPEAAPVSAPEGFVRVTDAVPGAVIEVRYAGSNNFTGAPLPGYAPGVLWLHHDTAAALAKAQAFAAESGLRLRVYDAYRPARASEAMVAWAESNGRTSLLREGYIGRRSSHARGNTVDVTLDGPEGKPLEMGTPWDTFDPSSHYAAARGEAKRNRVLLRRVMTRAGFVPYAREWWHFSLPGDLPWLDVPYASR